MSFKVHFRLTFTVGLGVCALLLGFAAPSQAQLLKLDDTSFRPNLQANPNPFVLFDGDVIMVTRENDSAIPDGQVEIALKTESNVTWWKEIKAVRKTVGSSDKFEAIESVSAQDAAHGPTSFRLKKVAWPDALVFSKAKREGLHYETYILEDIRSLIYPRNGRLYNKLTFTWQHDNWQRVPGLSRSRFRPGLSEAPDRYLLSDGDVIMLQWANQRSEDSGELEIVLQTDPSVTWWKEIKLRLWTVGPTGMLVEPYTDFSPVSTQDNDHGPHAFSVNKSYFTTRGQLIFSKAKAFGAHTETYAVWGSEFTDYPASRLLFTWQKD